MKLESCFGPSIEFIKSILQYNKPNLISNRESTNSLIKEAKFLASSTYADKTKWGQEVSQINEQFILLAILSWIINR